MTNDAFPVIPSFRLPTPGKCYKCGSDQRDCIDLGYDAEYYGAVLLCLQCAHSLVDVPELEFVTKQSVADLEFDIAKLRKSEAKLSSARAALVNGILASVAVFDDTLDRDDPPELLTLPPSKADFGDFFEGFSKPE